jgi:hypothetical protein
VRRSLIDLSRIWVVSMLNPPESSCEDGIDAPSWRVAGWC